MKVAKKKKKRKLCNNLAYQCQADGTRILITANEAAQAESRQNRRGCIYLCPGEAEGKECLATMNLVHRRIPEDIWFFRCDRGEHINDCPYCSEFKTKNISTLTDDSERIKLEAQLSKLMTLDELAQKRGKRTKKPNIDDPDEDNVDDTEPCGRVIDVLVHTVRGPQKLIDSYKVLKSSMLHDLTADGHPVENVIIESRTFEAYRNGRLVLERFGIVVAGGGVYPGLSDEFLKKKQYTIALKDPYMSLTARNSIVYIIEFESKELYEYYIVKRRIKLKDKSIYLILGKWKQLNSVQNPRTKYYNCRIEKPGQIIRLTSSANLEEAEKLHKDFRILLADE